MCLIVGGCGEKPQSPVLRVAMPYSDKVQDPDTNYYINWLEDKTGLDIEISLIRQKGVTGYLDTLFSSDLDVDVVFFGEDFTIDEETLKSYTDREDSPIYTEKEMEYLNYGSEAGVVAQVLWINYRWLENLGLSMPETVKDLQKVLEEFETRDPNGNGIKDEIPLAGNKDIPTCDPTGYLMDLYTSDEKEKLKHEKRMYDDELKGNPNFDMTIHELSELVNSQADMVGGFMATSIADVIYKENPEVMARYVHVPPLADKNGNKYAVFTESEPKTGAIILSRGDHKKEAKLLLDTMMTEEASLIARYGEQGVDWDFSDGSDVSIYGSVATIVTRNYIRDISQNKHLNGIGPMKVPEQYLRGVTWTGINSDTEYIDARAQMTYRDATPSSDINDK